MSSNQMKNETHEDEDQASLYALTMSTSFTLGFVLNAVSELGIFDIIATVGHNVRISPHEIVSRLPTQNSDAPTAVDRMLQLLVSHSIVTCSTSILPDGKVERLYGLTPASKFFVSDENGLSLAQINALISHKESLAAWGNLKDAILKGGVPIENVTGMPFYELVKTDEESDKLFNKAMTAQSTTIIKRFLKKYKGFEGLGSIVDVGGGHGSTLNMIISQYPSIKGINFDLPNVVDGAPYCQGVKHIGGDMFLEVPRGDAILMKNILHNWSDDKCVKLLKNCFKALPRNGKIIIIDNILPKVPQTDNAGKYACQLDMIMFTIAGGKKRTEDEFKNLAIKAGFGNFHVVLSAFGMSIMELIK